MHCQGIVFGDEPQRLMDSLIQTSSLPPADVWTPLDVADADGRSGWHTVSDTYRQLEDRSPFVYGNWVHCAWPTSFLREHLGPHALLSDGGLTSREVPRQFVEKKDGRWRVRLPRFFDTIGVVWSMTYRSSRWQGHSSADAAEGATVASLDLEYNLTTHDPNLIVGPRGPVFYQSPDTEGHDVARRRLDATRPLMELPPSTTVTLVSWHDTHGGDLYDWSGQTDPCDCFGSRRRQGSFTDFYY